MSMATSVPSLLLRHRRQRLCDCVDGVCRRVEREPASGNGVEFVLVQQARSLIEVRCRGLNPGGGGGGSGGEPPGIDPIIAGLLKRLPKSGDVWPEAERKLWLELLSGSFKLIYKD